MAANLVLRSIILSLYFFLTKPYRKLIEKLIITTVIITNVIANFIKQPVVYKDLLKDFKLFIAAVYTREERKNKYSFTQYTYIVNKVGADYNKSLLIWRRLYIK